MSSILTNTGAMTALQTLTTTNKNLEATQSQISTGKKVATAQDNASSWSIAKTMQSDVSSLSKVKEGLVSASAMVGTARSAAEQISDMFSEIKDKVAQAQQPDADTAKIQADVDGLTQSIADVANAAQYNGINFVGAGGANQDVLTGINRDGAGVVTAQTTTVAAVDLDALAGSGAAGTFDVTVAGTLDAVDTALDSTNAAAAGFGTTQNQIERQSEFVSSQVDALKTGVGALVDANMEEASARLTALQTQQQLGVQALSIANQAPQNILSLFR